MADILDELATLQFRDVHELIRTLDATHPAPVRPKRKAKTKRRHDPSAARIKRYRLRQRLGKIVLQIEADEHELAQYLIETRRVSEAESMSRYHVESAVQQVVAELVERWLAQKV